MLSFTAFLNEGAERVAEHDTIDKNVWTVIGSKEPILSDEIYKQIMMNVSDIQDIVMVDKVYLTGDLLTKHWLDDTDMDVYVVIDKDNVSTIAYERLMKFIKARAGDFAGHTRHRLKYHLELVEDEDAVKKLEASSPGIYDILKQKWLKVPSSSTQEVAEKVSVFMGRVKAIGMDQSAKIDWDYFLDVDKDNLDNLKTALQSKAFDIYNELSDEPDDVKKTIKRFAYGDPPTVEEIEKLYDKEKIPATIMQKLAIQYYISEYLKRLADKMGDDKMTTDNALPPGGETVNRFDPFPRENVPESRKIQSFGEFLTESGLVQPQYKIAVNNGVMHGDLLANEMKKKEFASVPITDQQARDIELKYDLTAPDEKNPFRRLGKTDGMAIIRTAPKAPGQKPGIVLVKNKMFNGMSGGIKK